MNCDLIMTIESNGMAERDFEVNIGKGRCAGKSAAALVFMGLCLTRD